MTVNYANQDKVTTFSASSGATGIADNTDKLHSGIIKVLHKMAKGNYVIEFGNFQQLQGSSASTKYGTISLALAAVLNVIAVPPAVRYVSLA